MAAPLEEITGVYRGERQRWDATVIIEVDRVVARDGNNKPISNGHPIYATLKGTAEQGELEFGLTYNFYGRWTTHAKYGPQFLFQTFVRAQPHGQTGIIRYLARAPWIGQAIAAALWHKFGSDAVRIVRESPDVAAAAVSGLTAERAAEAARFLDQERALESCSIDLMELLASRGFPKQTSRKAVQRWGNRAPELLRRNPYLLMAFRGCGFLRTDAMYIDLGLPPNSLKRQALAAWHTLASDTDGHTWHPIEKAVAGIRSRVAGAEIAAPAAIKLAKRAKLIATRRDAQGKLFVAEQKKANAEERVAKFLAAALSESLDIYGDQETAWPDAHAIPGIDGEQPEKLAAALRGRVGLFGGSPGTGKTYTVACLAKVIVERFGAGCLAIAAPTGKAAVRVTEAMESYGLTGIRATTIHSLLRVAENDSVDGWSFEHDEYNPLPQRFIIVDESSMLDATLMASLLAARNAGAHMLFVGDINQLPPVGHGAPLRDMIAAGLPYGELREIRRNSGTIVRACAQMRDGQRFAVDEYLDTTCEPAKNLVIRAAASAQDQLDTIIRVIEEAREAGLDPVWDVQVLAAVNAKSKLSRKALNDILQRHLNRHGKKAGGNPFGVGDKLVCTKNQLLPVHHDDQLKPQEADRVFVANGELARVIDVADNLTIAELSNPTRVVKIPRGQSPKKKDHSESETNNDDEQAGTGCNFDLGFCISCHRAQGSEWPWVVVVADDYAGAQMVCSREWWYTALSRAKIACFIIGKRITVDSACRRVALPRRKTFLKELIIDCLAQTMQVDTARQLVCLEVE